MTNKDTIVLDVDKNAENMFMTIEEFKEKIKLIFSDLGFDNVPERYLLAVAKKYKDSYQETQELILELQSATPAYLCIIRGLLEAISKG